MATQLKAAKRSPKALGENGSLPKYDVKARPLWEIASELSALVPEEELAKIPTDASGNLHHYLYSAPRAEQ